MKTMIIVRSFESKLRNMFLLTFNFQDPLSKDPLGAARGRFVFSDSEESFCGPGIARPDVLLF